MGRVFKLVLSDPETALLDRALRGGSILVKMPGGRAPRPELFSVNTPKEVRDAVGRIHSGAKPAHLKFLLDAGFLKSVHWLGNTRIIRIVPNRSLVGRLVKTGRAKDARS